MKQSAHTWPIVLAAGEGSRLHCLTTTSVGVAVPKQFCSLHDGASLLDDALRRAQSIAPPAQICTVVARQHQRWWRNALGLLPERNVIVQPRNCGTGIGILLPLLHIVMRDPDAHVVLLPSDHHVREERVLTRALRMAAAEVEARPDQMVALGIAPDEADPELGYIVPGAADGRGIAAVDRFVEKPAAPLARSLVEAGALWNAFIVAANARTLLRLFETRFPQVVAAMQDAVRRDASCPNDPVAVQWLYANLPSIDFSRHVMQGAEAALRVLRVSHCGWSDLGTPTRVAETLRRSPRASGRDHPGAAPAILSLAVQQGHATAQG